MSVRRLNSRLNEMLREIKGANSKEKLEGLTAEVNEVLYSAILSHPDKVNAIGIEINADVNRDDYRIPNFGRRGMWRRYIEKVTGKMPNGTVHFTFNANLPFQFGAEGHHGSGHRAAGFASFQKMLFETHKSVDEHPATFKIDLAHGQWPANNLVHFTPDELTSIKLIQISDDELSPVLTSDLGQLANQRPALWHYLNFRGANKSPISATGLPHEDRQLLDTVKKIAEMDESGLKLRISNGKLSGFAILDEEKDPVVYEFTGFKLPKNAHQTHKIIAAAYAINSYNPRASIKRYQGNSIITRLKKIRPRKEFTSV